MASYKSTKYQMTSAQVNAFAHRLGIKIPLSALRVDHTSGDIKYYSVQDAVAFAKNKGITNTKIAESLDVFDYNYGSNDQYSAWTNTDIKNLNANYNPAITKIADTINAARPAAQAYIVTKRNSKGENTYTLYFNDANGDKIGVDLEGTDSFLYKSGTVNNSKLNAYINSNAAVTEAMKSAMGNTNLSASKGGSGSGSGGYSYTAPPKQILPTNQTLTDADIAALRTSIPDIDKYIGVTAGEDSNVVKNLIADYVQSKGPDSINRSDLDVLLSSADSYDDTLLGRTQQSINNQTQQLLRQIKNDPELYNAVVSQLRTDAGTGVIAGQRAANIASQTEAAKADYSGKAEELLQSLLGSEGVAGSTRDAVFGSKATALDAYIQAQLNKASVDAYKRQTDSTELAQLLSLLGGASSVAASQYETDTAKAAALADIFAEKKDVATTGTAGGVTNADYTTSKTVSGVQDVNLTNKQYTDLINNPEALRLLTDAAFKEATASKTYADILKEYGLADVLGDGTSDTKLAETYAGFVDEANKESNQVFNQAQRAYIESIAAGDSQTADALTRLAMSTGGSRGNLYASSALADQYKQQTSKAITGTNLLDTWQQQVADNKMTLDSSKIDAHNAMTGYIGNGMDTAGKGTLSGVKNILDTASTVAKQGYVDWASDFMKNRQNVKNSQANAKLNDFIRINSLANDITKKNISGAINNKS